MATTPNPSFDISTDQGLAQRNEGLNIGLVLESGRVTRERAKGLLADAIKSFDANGNPPRGFQTTVENVIMVVEQALNEKKETGTSEEDPNSKTFRETYGPMGSTAKATKELLEEALRLLSRGGARRKRRSKTYRKRKLLRKRTSRRN
jgi:hypothetical protein